MKKRKIFTVVLIFSILMATLAGCDKADKVSDTTKKPVIKIGSDNYPPYNFLNEDGIPTGIDVELATEAFRRMGYKTEIVQINWEKKKELVESGDRMELSVDDSEYGMLVEGDEGKLTFQGSRYLGFEQ